MLQVLPAVMQPLIHGEFARRKTECSAPDVCPAHRFSLAAEFDHHGAADGFTRGGWGNWREWDEDEEE